MNEFKNQSLLKKIIAIKNLNENTAKRQQLFISLIFKT